MPRLPFFLALTLLAIVATSVEGPGGRVVGLFTDWFQKGIEALSSEDRARIAEFNKNCGKDAERAEIQALRTGNILEKTKTFSNWFQECLRMEIEIKQVYDQTKQGEPAKDGITGETEAGRPERERLSKEIQELAELAVEQLTEVYNAFCKGLAEEALKVRHKRRMTSMELTKLKPVDLTGLNLENLKSQKPIDTRTSKYIQKCFLLNEAIKELKSQNQQAKPKGSVSTVRTAFRPLKRDAKSVKRRLEYKLNADSKDARNARRRYLHKIKTGLENVQNEFDKEYNPAAMESAIFGMNEKEWDLYLKKQLDLNNKMLDLRSEVIRSKRPSSKGGTKGKGPKRKNSTKETQVKRHLTDL